MGNTDGNLDLRDKTHQQKKHIFNMQTMLSRDKTLSKHNETGQATQMGVH